MKARNEDAERLKRLVEDYADACAKFERIDDWRHPSASRLRKKCEDIRTKLYDEIDRLTSIDLTPRSVLEDMR